MTVNLLEWLDVGQHERRAKAPGKENERARAPGEPERGQGLPGGTQLRLPEAGMSLLGLPQSLIDAFELQVLLDLGDGTVERRAVAFVLPVGHILGQFVGVSHPSPRHAQGAGGLGLTGLGPKARAVSRCGRFVWESARWRASSLTACS